MGKEDLEKRRARNRQYHKIHHSKEPPPGKYKLRDKIRIMAEGADAAARLLATKRISIKK